MNSKNLFRFYSISLLILLSGCLVTGSNQAVKSTNNQSTTQTNPTQPQDTTPISPTPTPSPSSPGTDPLESEAWHLENSGQSSFSASGGSIGEDINQSQTHLDGINGLGIKIAVSDNGTEIVHEDLSANHLNAESRNYTGSSPSSWAAGGNPSPTGNADVNAHGTAVAGLIAAVENNSLGSRGVAPKASFAAFKYVGTSFSLAKDIDQANGNFDIFNYSYGRNSCTFVELSTSYIDQLKFGVTSLRAGKGAIYVKASGNEYRSSRSDCVSDAQGSYYGNANLEGDNSSGFVLVVGANTASGISAGYSTPGSSLWVSAPGGQFGINSPAMISTDLMGCNRGMSANDDALNDFDKGLNALNTNCNYTSTMNGTSSSTPIISGSIALILQANPNLTWRDIRFILAKTARKIDASRGVTGHPDGFNLAGHDYQLGWQTNNAGFNFHNWYGFGAIDVDAAVNMAKTYSTNLGSFLETNWADDSGTISISIPDASSVGAESVLNVSTDIEIEAVQLRVTIDHTFSSDLGIELTSPEGSKSKLLHINSAIFESSLNDVTLLSNAFYGERSAGDWTLKIVDGAGQDVGSLTNWKLNFHGHSPINIATISSDVFQDNQSDNQKVETNSNNAFAKRSITSLVSEKTSKELINSTELKRGKTSFNNYKTDQLSKAIASLNDLSIQNIEENEANRLCSISLLKGNYSSLIIKRVCMNSLGEIISDKELSIDSIQKLIQIKEDSNNNLIVLGEGETGAYLIKLDQEGNVIWREAISRPGVELSLSLDSLDNIYISKINKKLISLLKYSSKGRSILKKVIHNFDVERNIEKQILKISKSNELFLVLNYKDTLSHLEVLTISINGNVLKTQKYSYELETIISNSIIIENKGLILLGHTKADIAEKNGGGLDALVMKFNLSGELEWMKQFGSKTIGLRSLGNERLYKAIYNQASESIIISGTTDESLVEQNPGGLDVFIASLSLDGKALNISHAGKESLGKLSLGDELPISFIKSKDSLNILINKDGKKSLLRINDKGRVTP